jgi:F-type H+-transporting ATPase subunit delta
MDERVAKRYGAAIFGAAKKTGVVSEVEKDLFEIVALLGDDARFLDFLLSPEVRRDEKRAIVEKLFAESVAPLTMDALRMLLAKRREDLLPGIYDEFERLRRDDQRVIYAKIATAEPLDENEKKALLDKLTKEIGKTLEPEFTVDPSLIGGVRVAYENMVLDGSIRGGLGRLRSAFHYDLLKQA